MTEVMIAEPVSVSIIPDRSVVGSSPPYFHQHFSMYTPPAVTRLVMVRHVCEQCNSLFAAARAESGVDYHTKSRKLCSPLTLIRCAYLRWQSRRYPRYETYRFSMHDAGSVEICPYNPNPAE